MVVGPVSLLALMSLSASPVLYVGDSISYGKFGTAVDSALRQLSANVVTESSCGSAPSNWLPQVGDHPPPYSQTICGFWEKTPTQEFRIKIHNTPQIQEELNTLLPVVTVVQLGTNIASRKDPAALRPTVHQMMDVIRNSGSQCIWVGPPDAHSTIVTREKLKITNDMIREEADSEGCAFVDTLSFTQFPDTAPGDGIHPDPQLSETWGEAVADRVAPLVQQIVLH
jgi:hypothetical protein